MNRLVVTALVMSIEGQVGAERLGVLHIELAREYRKWRERLSICGDPSEISNLVLQVHDASLAVCRRPALIVFRESCQVQRPVTVRALLDACGDHAIMMIQIVVRPYQFDLLFFGFSGSVFG